LRQLLACPNQFLKPDFPDLSKHVSAKEALVPLILQA
jgi:hypothetical protein